MRDIGIVPDENHARLLKDHLLSQGITVKLAPGKGGWTVWVHNEDLVPQAAQEFRAFLQEPDAPRYRESSQVARQIKKATVSADRTHRKNTRNLRDRWEGPSWRQYPFTFALIAVSLIVGILTNSDRLIRSSTIHALVFSDYTIGPDFQPEGLGLTNILHGQVWRLITPIFLHFGVQHFIFNMLALVSLGRLIEIRKGTRKFAILVIVIAIASNVGEYLGESQQARFAIFGGMSGVVYALFGYLLTKMYTHPDEGLGISSNNILIMIGWFFLCLTGYLGPIANFAHGVGWATGMLLGLTRF